MNLLKSFKKITSPDLRVTISKEKLQKEISSTFPKNFEKLMASLSIYDPVVSLSPATSFVEMSMQVTAKAPLLGEQKGTITARGNIFFNKEKR
jgi:hypothetical protein